jgi:hypothetical protein
LKKGSGRLLEPLIYHEFSGQEMPSAVEQLSNRVVWPDDSRNTALSTEAAQLVDCRQLGTYRRTMRLSPDLSRNRTCGFVFSRETSFRGLVCHCFKSYSSLKPVRPIPNTTVLDTAGARRPMIEQRLVYPDSKVPESPKNFARNQFREIDWIFRRPSRILIAKGGPVRPA